MAIVNEILATSYAKVFYNTEVPKTHSFTLYFGTPFVADLLVPNVWHVGGTNPATSDQWQVSEVVVELINRMKASFANFPEMQIERVELYESASGDNTFVGFDLGDYSDVADGGGAFVAAGYLIANFQTVTRDNWRLMFLDYGDARPQRTPQALIPATDDDSPQWFIANSTVGFTNQDGQSLVRITSYNTGYNRALARKYGRSISP